jgi:hypothetical protein
MRESPLVTDAILDRGDRLRIEHQRTVKPLALSIGESTIRSIGSAFLFSPPDRDRERGSRSREATTNENSLYSVVARATRACCPE